MQAQDKPKKKRRGGILAEFGRSTRVVTAVVLAVTCAALAFTQLGFAGFGWNGEYSAYLVIELIPISLAALLLGALAGLFMGLFAGAMLLIHSMWMPLNFYEYTFVTPLTSVVMMGVTGLLLGLLFRFVLRNDPGPIKTVIYITLVCVIVSWLYSIGFVFNAFISVPVDAVVNDAIQSAEQARKYAQDRVWAIVLRMGEVPLQAQVDGVLMALSCIAAFFITRKAKRIAGNVGLRSMFAVHLSIVVLVAFMITSAASFISITQSELDDAIRDMEEDIVYLWNQIDNSDKRTEKLYSLLSDVQKTDSLTDKQYSELIDASALDGLLDGYTMENDGTILVLVSIPESDFEESATADGESASASSESASSEGLEESSSAAEEAVVSDEKTTALSEDFGPSSDWGYLIVLSDDERFEVGKMLDEVVGDDYIASIGASAATGDVERVVYDQDYGKDLVDLEEEEVITIRSEIVYLLAKEKNNCTVVKAVPSRMVFAKRFGIMIWTAFMVFLILAAVFATVFILLDCVIVRRIDETNGTLARITEGDLNAKADVRDTREFASLSDGVNETVGALKGWIAEAESRIDTELATAKAIQKSALPGVFPPYPDILKFDVYASMQAAREVGGDFYDFFLIGDDSDADSGKLGFIIADVSGKGVPAALFMMKSMTQLRDYLKAGVEVSEAVENANRQLCEGNDEGMFVTAWAGVLDYATGHVDFANAGHNPPLLWQKAGGWRWLTEKSGLPLGLFEGLPYESFSVDCGVGDQFLLYTDGVTEAMSEAGELYGEDRLLELVSENYTQHPRMLVEALRRSVAVWAQGAEQSDDITILALEVGVPPEITATLTLPADANELPRVNEFIHSELDRRMCPKRVQNQLDIAVEELFVNVCHYAYPDATPENPGTVRVRRTYRAEPPSVVVDIVDEGIPYNPLAKPDAVTPDDIEEVPIGGLGILMAKRCTDEMLYERTGESNIATIVKKW